MCPVWWLNRWGARHLLAEAEAAAAEAAAACAALRVMGMADRWQARWWQQLLTRGVPPQDRAAARALKRCGLLQLQAVEWAVRLAFAV